MSQPDPFADFLRDAQLANLTHVEETRVFYRLPGLCTTLDPTNPPMPVFCLCPSNLPNCTDAFLADMEKFVIRSVHEAAQGGRYVVVYCHYASNDLVKSSRFAVIKQIYRKMPRLLRKNVHALYILHPSFLLKSLFVFMRPFLSSKFCKKLHYASQIHEISTALSMDIQFPECIVNHDRGLGGGGGALMTIPFGLPSPPSNDVSGQSSNPMNITVTGGGAGGGPGNVVLGKFFGKPLSEVCADEALSVAGVPKIVIDCVRFIERHGLNTVGVYRVPGDARLIEQLKSLYDDPFPTMIDHTSHAGKLCHSLQSVTVVVTEPAVTSVEGTNGDSETKTTEPTTETVTADAPPVQGTSSLPVITDTLTITDGDVCVVAGLLKNYLGSLPVPLFPEVCYAGLMEAVPTVDGPPVLPALIAALANMTDDHRHVAEFVIRHLHAVTTHSDTNKMTAANIGVVFGPTLIRVPIDASNPLQAVNDTKVLNRALAACVSYCEECFGKK